MRQRREAIGAVVALSVALGLAYLLWPSSEPEEASPSSTPSAQPSQTLAEAPEPSQPEHPPVVVEPSVAPTPHEETGLAGTKAGLCGVFGRVTCAGEPAAHARVRLTLRPTAAGEPLEGEVFADAQGRYEFVAPSAFVGEAAARAFLSRGGELHGGSAKAQVPGGGRVRLDLDLPPWKGVKVSVSGSSQDELITLWAAGPSGWSDFGGWSIEPSGQRRFEDAFEGSLVGVGSREDPFRYLFGRSEEGELKIEEIGAAELKVRARTSAGKLVPCAIAFDMAGHPPLQPQQESRYEHAPALPMWVGDLLGGLDRLPTQGETTTLLPPGFRLRVIVVAEGPKGGVLRAARTLTLARGERRTLELTLSPLPETRLALGGVPGGAWVWGHVPAGVACRKEGDAVLFSGLLPDERIWIGATHEAEGTGKVDTGRLALRAGEAGALKLSEPGRVVLTNYDDALEECTIVADLEPESPWTKVRYLEFESGEPTRGPAGRLLEPFEWTVVGPGALETHLPAGRYHLIGPYEQRFVSFEVRPGVEQTFDLAKFEELPR